MDIEKITFKEEVFNEKELKELENRFKNEVSIHKNLNPERLYHILYVYHLMRKLMNDGELTAKVSYEIIESKKYYGEVKIIGENLIFNESELFVRAIDLASNFDVCITLDKKIDICFTFYGLK